MRGSRALKTDYESALPFALLGYPESKHNTTDFSTYTARIARIARIACTICIVYKLLAITFALLNRIRIFSLQAVDYDVVAYEIATGSETTYHSEERFQIASAAFRDPSPLHPKG